MDRNDTIRTLAEGVIAEYGAEAAAVASRQIEISDGDAKATWITILAAIEEQDRLARP